MTEAGQRAARRPRRDAQRNRAALLQAAQEVFAEHGVDAGVELVARRAGVGPATLYRHFATKAQLIEEVLTLRAAVLIDVLLTAAAVDDPRKAFRGLLHAIADVQVHDRSYRDLLAWRDRTSDHPHTATMELGRLILEACDRAHAAGVLRRDATAHDVALTLMALDSVAGPVGRLEPDALHRFVDVVADGLCHAGEPLGGRPLDEAELEAAAKARR